MNNTVGILKKLTVQEIEKELAGLSGWKITDNKIHKDYVFVNFNQAFGFMTRAAMEIEKMNHHPEWFNVYNKISVDLRTHDVNGVTQNDIVLAKILDSLL